MSNVRIFAWADPEAAEFVAALDLASPEQWVAVVPEGAEFAIHWPDPVAVTLKDGTRLIAGSDPVRPGGAS